MEIFLNLVWAALALTLVGVWLKTPRAKAHSRLGQFVAIAVLIAILFPVISVSDDLMAVQNATETDNCQRRDHLQPANPHPLLPAAELAPPPVFAGLASGLLRYVSPDGTVPRAIDAPARSSIQNRPPPAA